MIYLDTSVVVALLTPEASSPGALEWLEQCRDTLISSDWLITETHSALGLKQQRAQVLVVGQQVVSTVVHRSTTWRG